MLEHISNNFFLGRALVNISKESSDWIASNYFTNEYARLTLKILINYLKKNYLILPGLQGMQSPLLFLITSPDSGSTLTIEIGYTDGMIRETKPMTPTVLSGFTEKKIFISLLPNIHC